MIAILSAGVVLAQAYSCANLEADASAFADAVYLEQSQQYCPGMNVSPQDFEIIARLKGVAFDCGDRWPGVFSSIERQTRTSADAHGKDATDAYCSGLEQRLPR